MIVQYPQLANDIFNHPLIFESTKNPVPDIEQLILRAFFGLFTNTDSRMYINPEIAATQDEL